jgi:tetratricopeptide (TPR) repeat protein
MEHGRQPRVYARVAIGLKIGDQINMRLTRDISMSGVFVELDQSPPLGESVELFISLPNGGETLHLEGSVARAADDGVGIWFQNPSPEARSALEGFLEYLRQQGAPPSPPHLPGQSSPPPPKGNPASDVPDEFNQQKIEEALALESRERERRRQEAERLRASAKTATDPARAAEMLQEAIKLSPGIAELHQDLGNVYYQLGEVERAVVEFERALALQAGGN